MNTHPTYRLWIIRAAIAAAACAAGLPNAAAQQDTLAPPHLRRATIDLRTQRYRIDWDIPPDTARVRYYRIGRRIERPTGGYVYAEDELIYGYIYETSFMRFPDGWGCCFPQVFAINSMPKDEGRDYGPWGEGFQTMYQYPVRLDTCEQDIELLWTPYNKINSYNFYPTSFERDLSYLVYVCEGEAFVPARLRLWADAGNAAHHENRVFRINRVEGSHTWHFVIAAVYNDGRDTSYSNVQRVSFDFLMHPDIKLDSIISQQMGNRSFFRIGANSAYTNFALQRSRTMDTGFAVVERFDKYTRTSIDSAGEAYFYRISAMKACGTAIKSSAAVSSLSVQLIAREAQNQLRWNAIYPAPRAGAVYTLYRTAPNRITIATTPDLWAIDYETAIYSSQGYCYYADGTASDSIGRAVAYVRSARVCYEAMSVWFMPNAVSPFRTEVNHETGIRGNDFRPICSQEHKFILKIMDRWGGEVYSGNNEGWNGVSSTRDAAVPEGVYSYWVRIFFKNGKTEERTGKVILVLTD